MSSRIINDNKYNEWAKLSRVQLKNKIRENYSKRCKACENVINRSLNRFFPKSNISFKISESTNHQALHQLFSEVDKWPGVDLKAVQQKKKKLSEWKHKDYHERADNWWNRYKAEWIGNYLFYVLFTIEIDQFIEYNGCKYCMSANNISQNNNNNAQNIITDLNKKLLKCILIRDIMATEIKFTRAKDLPLILDQSYTKSNLLIEFFKSIGDECNMKFKMPPKSTVTLYFHIIRSSS